MRAEGWDTWDIRCLNAVMRPHEMLEVRVGLYDTADRLYQDEFLWKDMKRLGRHMPGGGYFDLDLAFRDWVFTVRFASEDDRFVYKIIPQELGTGIKFFISFLFRWGAEGTISHKNQAVRASTCEKEYEFTVTGSPDPHTRVNVSHQGILLEAQRPIYIRCNHRMTETEMDEFLRIKEEKCKSGMVVSSGMLEDGAEAIVKGIAWNTVFDRTRDRVCTPVSRRWCTANGKSFGSYVLFGWDTFFNGLLAGIQDKELARTQVRSILDEVTDRGLVPNCGSERGASADRSEPPVGAYCVLKLYRQFGDISLVEESFEKLLAWNRWWMLYRDGNGDGLLEWGSDPDPEVLRAGFQNHSLQAAKYESGLDDSPMYDDAVFNPETNTMELTDIGLNALYALDCWAMSELAGLLGKAEIAAEMKDGYDRLKELVNRELWDEKSGIYRNKGWDGCFSGRISPTSFYPMIAGIASEAQAKRMVREHLQNEGEFWGRYVLPSISKDDSAYCDQKFWRGRVWAPMNFLVSEGLKRYGMDDLSYAFSRCSLELFLHEWKEKNHIHENYNAVTGEGDDQISDPFYTWGALLAYIAVGELVEAQPWGSLRFGNLSGEEAGIENYAIGNDRYSVYTGSGLTVLKNGAGFIRTTVPAILYTLSQKGTDWNIRIKYREKGSVTLHLCGGTERVNVEAKDQRLTFVPVEGTVRFELP